MSSIQNSNLWKKFVEQKTTDSAVKNQQNEILAPKKVETPKVSLTTPKDSIELSQAVPKAVTIADIEISTKKNKKENAKKDPLLNYPLRLCAYANEVGAALAPIPNIGGKLFNLSWVPALMYFGADIYDKYSRGEENDYSHSSKVKGAKQAIFQALASVLLPTAAVIAGQNTASGLSKLMPNNKLTANQKEDILDAIKVDINHDYLRNHKADINEVISKHTDLDLKSIIKQDRIKHIKNKITNGIYNDIKHATDSVRETQKRASKPKKLFRKMFGWLSHSHGKYKNLAKIKEENFEANTKKFIQNQVNELVDTRVTVQYALNDKGIIQENFEKLDSGAKKLLKKAVKLLKKTATNYNIKGNKDTFAVKELVLKKLNKAAMKPSVIKIIGGFTALATCALPIDYFVENIVIKKVVDPGIDEIKEGIANAKRLKDV